MRRSDFASQPSFFEPIPGSSPGGDSPPLLLARSAPLISASPLLVRSAPPPQLAAKMLRRSNEIVKIFTETDDLTKAGHGDVLEGKTGALIAVLRENHTRIGLDLGLLDTEITKHIESPLRFYADLIRIGRITAIEIDCASHPIESQHLIGRKVGPNNRLRRWTDGTIDHACGNPLCPCWMPLSETTAGLIQ